MTEREDTNSPSLTGREPRSKRARRRVFLRAGLGAGVAAIAAPGIARSYPANEEIRIGAIGTGGRSRRALIPAAKAAGSTRLVAVCDVWTSALEAARALADAGAFATKNHDELLARKDIDAVIIATPDHLHVPVTVDACRAGKDVYVEKPLTHNVAEGAAVIAAQNEHRRVVQVGMQQRSMPQFVKAHELVRSGALGTIFKVHLTWNRNADIRRHAYGIRPQDVDWKRFLGGAKSQDFDEYRFRNWRWFWDFGGGILTDLMVHYIDVAHWFLGLDHPETAATIGDHIQAQGLWETPETIQTLLHYPKNGVQIYFEGTFSNARNRAMLEFMGRNGTLYLDRGRYEFHPERGRGEFAEFAPGKDERGADFDRAVDGGLFHMKNWLECVRSRAKPRAPAEAGVSAVTGAHLGNLAYRRAERVRWTEPSR